MSRTKYPLLVLAVVGTACTTPLPSVERGPDAEVTYDGLHRVVHSSVQYAWAKPDISLKGYDKILPAPAGIQYRAVRARPRSTATDFPLTDNQKERLQETVSDVFREELAKSEYFTLADEPGPSTLIIRGGLLDVVSHVPPEPSGRGDVYLRSVGEITLVLEIRDSLSGEILARAVDRRAAQPDAITESNRAANLFEVRRVARHWARLLRTRLDQLHDL